MMEHPFSEATDYANKVLQMSISAASKSSFGVLILGKQQQLVVLSLIVLRRPDIGTYRYRDFAKISAQFRVTHVSPSWEKRGSPGNLGTFPGYPCFSQLGETCDLSSDHFAQSGNRYGS